MKEGCETPRTLLSFFVPTVSVAFAPSQREAQPSRPTTRTHTSPPLTARGEALAPNDADRRAPPTSCNVAFAEPLAAWGETKRGCGRVARSLQL
jgi:hypothetical protein